MRILIVDDHRSARKVLKGMLASVADAQLLEAGSLEDTLVAAEQESPDLILLDIRLSDDPRDRGGLEVVRRLRAKGNAVPIVMVSSLTEVSEIRQAMRLGAQDYVFKDELAPEMLLPIVESHRERLSLRREVSDLRSRVEGAFGVGAIVGSSSHMDRLRATILRVADSDATVLIRGETGTGKELVARALHQTSQRHVEPFVPVNCSALPSTLMESLIFGHERGVFTGADRRVKGQLELAGSGTVLLDEIAEMPQELQSKLLRVLEDRKFRPLGAEAELPVKARILAATHADLEQRLADGRFRSDLYYRLDVVTIQVPPLAERTEDIPELVAAFASEFASPPRLADDAIAWLCRRVWPGNVRQLKNAIQRLVLLAGDDPIDAALAQELLGSTPDDLSREVARIARALLALPDRVGSKLQTVERAVLHHAVEVCGGNKSAAARMIGVDRKALERRWDRLSDGPDDHGDKTSK